jgi:hypothetical protein
MHQVDEVREALDREFVLDPGRSGNWEDVLGRAKAGSPRSGRRRSYLIALAGAVAAVAVGVLLWPGGDGSASILERARAVVSAGPVIHLVLEAEDGRMTEVDLKTGKRRRLEGRHEQWFDPERGFHDLYTVDGRAQRDVLYTPGSTPEIERQFIEFTSAYRKALDSGRASVAGKGTEDGRKVYWIRFHVRYPSFGIPNYAAEHEVAVDAETFEPRIWRATQKNDALGIPESTTEIEIEFWETLPAGGGDFTAAIDGNALPEDWRALSRLGPRTPEQARSVLAPPPLWLGDEFRGLPLAGIYELRAEHGRSAADSDKEPGLEVRYGARPNDTSRGGELHVGLTQTNTPIPWLGWETIVMPAKGTMIVGQVEPEFVLGFVRKHGVYVSITASDQGLLLAAAQALKPIPGG